MTVPHRRHSIRLKEYDYSQARAYFVTLCVTQRELVFENPILKDIVNNVWNALPAWFPTIELDEFVVMPNHIHFIVWLTNTGPSNLVEATLAVARLAPAILPPTSVNTNPILGDVVGTFKSLTFKTFYHWVKTNDPSRRAQFWQRNYYEHIIRDDTELLHIREYILNNPLNWEQDQENPAP
jgi:putative transposase